MGGLAVQGSWIVTRAASRELSGVQRMKLVVLFLASLCVFAQEVQPTVRVEVTAENAPVPGAAVQLNGQTVQTGQDGIATAPVSLGSLKITVSKDGFFPANTTIDINEAKAWLVRIELQAQERVEEQITVHATRTDARIQDSPLRVEVLQREEVEEKMLMTPGDIVMMLNEMGGHARPDYLAVAWRGERAHAGNARAVHPIPFAMVFRSSGSKARASGSCRSRPWISDRSR